MWNHNKESESQLDFESRWVMNQKLAPFVLDLRGKNRLIHQSGKNIFSFFCFCSWKQRRIFISKSWIVCRYSISHSLSNTSSSTYTHTPAHTTSRTDTHSHTLTLIHHGFWNSKPYVLVESWALIFSFQALFKPFEAKQRYNFFPMLV